MNGADREACGRILAGELRRIVGAADWALIDPVSGVSALSHGPAGFAVRVGSTVWEGEASDIMPELAAIPDGAGWDGLEDGLTPEEVRHGH